MSNSFKKLAAPFALSLSLLLLLSPVVHAQSPLVPQCNGPCTACDFFRMGQNILNFIWLYITAPAATIMLVYGGFLMMMPGDIGGGKDSSPRYTKGKKVITRVIMAVLAIFFSWIIIDTILKVLSGDIRSSTPASLFPKSGNLGPWNRINCVAGSGASLNIGQRQTLSSPTQNSSSPSLNFSNQTPPAQTTPPTSSVSNQKPPAQTTPPTSNTSNQTDNSAPPVIPDSKKPEISLNYSVPPQLLSGSKGIEIEQKDESGRATGTPDVVYTDIEFTDNETLAFRQTVEKSREVFSNEYNDKISQNPVKIYFVKNNKYDAILVAAGRTDLINTSAVFSRATNVIIARGDALRPGPDNPSIMKSGDDLLTHEYAHVVLEKCDCENEWFGVHTFNKKGCPSNYGCTNDDEDFAETVVAYKQTGGDPDKLFKGDPESQAGLRRRFEFLKNKNIVKQ